MPQPDGWARRLKATTDGRIGHDARNVASLKFGKIETLIWGFSRIRPVNAS